MFESCPVCGNENVEKLDVPSYCDDVWLRCNEDHEDRLVPVTWNKMTGEES